jgi:glutamate-5-semialdehyde dehydrogenase
MTDLKNNEDHSVYEDSEATYKSRLAREASRDLANSTDAVRTRALELMADEIATSESKILAVNEDELTLAAENNLDMAFVDRMTLNHERIAAICEGVREVASLPDPIGNIEDMSERPNGLKIGKMRVPLGVMASVYEARPNVTIDIATIAVKSGNAVVLRSGSDVHRTSSLLAEIARRGIESSGLDPKILQFIESTDREEVSALLAADQYIDLVVPRGGTGLINKVKKEARMPVVAGGVGVCHTYVHSDADIQMATDIVVNAKTRRPSVCNTLDTVLVHREVARRFIPRLTNMLAKVGVTLHADSESIPMIDEAATVFPVKPEDYDTEWLSLNCSIKLVDDMHDALDHIERHGTGHSEAIITSSTESSKNFLKSVDAAAVFVNASTGFNDGGEFGLGCELGISTQKMHARGPMGLRELTSYKWIVLGDGQIRP